MFTIAWIAYTDLWLIDCHNMTGLFGDDLTSAFGKRDLIVLQIMSRPILARPSRPPAES